MIRDGVYADSNVTYYSDDRIRQALTVGLATLIGGTAGALLGRDVTSAGLAAQNEAISNIFGAAMVPKPAPVVPVARLSRTTVRRREAGESAHRCANSKWSRMCERVGKLVNTVPLIQNEFGGSITSKQKFAEKIETVLNNPSATEQFSNERAAYWDDATGVVIIANPKASSSWS